jgi:hypothetical protein
MAVERSDLGISSRWERLEIGTREKLEKKNGNKGDKEM